MAPQQPTQSNADSNGNDTTPPNAAREDVSLDEILYSSASFYAMVKPVALTMILTALCVVFINTPETLQTRQDQLTQSYVAFDVDESQSNAANAGLSIVNALVIVGVVCVMTFGIVLLYKYRCMKCLIGYMVLATIFELGYFGGLMFQTAIDIYYLAVDQFSFYFTLWNFSLVGAASIFYGKGFPMWVTQGSLIAVSVNLAWFLAALDPWTSWAVLIVLALYDLCAVLTPCGPLKALVNLMQQENSPDMPGLLYEAELPPEAQRPGRRQRPPSATVSSPEETDTQETTLPSAAPVPAPEQTASAEAREALPREGSFRAGERHSRSRSTQESVTGDVDEEAPTVSSLTIPGGSSVSNRVSTAEQVEDTAAASESLVSQLMDAPPPRPTGSIPFAIAKMYKLPLESPEPERRSDWEPLPNEGSLSPNERLARQYTPEQLKADVVAIFPWNGGSIERVGTKYRVNDRHGNMKRMLLLDNEGRVLEERQRTPEEERDAEEKSNSIKLGLGDFIFYSVLVSKAVLYSFTTFCACFLVILAGLGFTLILLAVYRHALPALPISIFLGVVFYLLTRVLIEPWFQAVLWVPYYV